MAYDDYDTVAHAWREAAKPTSGVEQQDDCWMKVAGPTEPQAWHAEPEAHRLKVADLKHNLVPTPSQLARFKIRFVDRADYYEWTYDGVLTFAGRKTVPPGVIVQSVSHTVKPAKVPDEAFVCVTVVNELDTVAQRAHMWTAGLPRGWPQINAIRERLRSEYALDPSTAPPIDADPVQWFLTEAKRGPDYLFATTSTLLLRSLGYRARLCLGYYAAPDAYDPETEHTPVRSDDLHFWSEVRLADGQWLIVEATPGYEVLPPRLTLVEQLQLAFVAMGAWHARHPIGASLLWLSLVFIITFRQRLQDELALVRWHCWPARTWQTQAQRALRIVERRGRWQGRNRAPQQSAAAWLHALNGPHWDSFARVVEWATYAPNLAPPWSAQEAHTICRHVLALDRMAYQEHSHG